MDGDRNRIIRPDATHAASLYSRRMIRKRVGDEFWLITQPDHARLAGAIARAVGNRSFARAGRPAVYDAVDRHDDGWAAHDHAPTLDDSGQPTDVFDTLRAIEHAAWLGSAERAVAADAYVGLLVALHSLALSALAAGAVAQGPVDDEHRRRQFDLNKIQHSLIEIVEDLRGRLGLAVDRPLRLGLAEGWSTAAEEQLKFDFRLLQAADVISLRLCCDHLPGGLVPQLCPRPGAAAVTLQTRVAHDGAMHVQPWPFAETVVRLDVPYRAVSALTHGDGSGFRGAFANAPVRVAHVELRAS